MLPSELFKGSLMTPLQQQVYDKWICARCHTKTMRFIHCEAGWNFRQCTSCKTVAVLSDQSTAAGSAIPPHS